MLFAARAPKNENVDEAYARLAKAEGLLPVKVTPFYKKKVDEEVAALGHTNGPLYRAVYPVAERMDVRAPNEVRDWVGDRQHMPKEAPGFIVQKYPDRMLFMPTSVCAAHCLYCFRQDVLSENKAHDPDLDTKIAALLEHLNKHPQTREVILSGGDPLMLSAADLEKIFNALRSVDTVQDIRIHSRAPIFAPTIMTEAKLALIAQHNVRFVFHIIHPYEICDEVAALILRMRAEGIRLYNHFPLLRKVNDHQRVLTQLIRTLQELGVDTFSVYVPEPLLYSAAYRIPFRRADRLIENVRASLPGWADFRFCLDTPAGKVQRSHLIAEDREAGTLVFQIEGKRVRYPDFPESLDQPGEIETLLWKGV